MKLATAELERLNQLRAEFLGIAAHDLRNPVGSIISVTEFLCDDLATVLTEEKLRFLSAIRSSSEFMLQLIDDFLDLSLIESGNLRSNRRSSDPRKLLERAVALNAMLAAEEAYSRRSSNRRRPAETVIR